MASFGLAEVAWGAHLANYHRTHLGEDRTVMGGEMEGGGVKKHTRLRIPGSHSVSNTGLRAQVSWSSSFWKVHLVETWSRPTCFTPETWVFRGGSPDAGYNQIRFRLDPSHSPAFPYGRFPVQSETLSSLCRPPFITDINHGAVR